MIFDITADVRTIPFPQFRINRMSYNVSRINLEVNAGMTEEWIIVNPNNATHPFHVHANPFVVKEVGSRFAYTPSASSPLDMLQQMKTITTRDVWRDTVIVPPLG